MSIVSATLSLKQDQIQDLLNQKDQAEVPVTVKIHRVPADAEYSRTKGLTKTEIGTIALAIILLLGGLTFVVLAMKEVGVIKGISEKTLKWIAVGVGILYPCTILLPSMLFWSYQREKKFQTYEDSLQAGENGIQLIIYEKKV